MEEAVGSGNMYLDSRDVEMPYEDEGQGDPQVIGLRYVGVTVPQGATITNAYLRFQVDEIKGGDPTGECDHRR